MLHERLQALPQVRELFNEGPALRHSVQHIALKLRSKLSCRLHQRLHGFGDEQTIDTPILRIVAALHVAFAF